MYKLLIVDDEPLVQIGLRSMLNYEELDIMIAGVAKDGQTAIDMILDLAPDIVMLDIKMPVYDGLQVMERVAAQTASPPVYIMLTSYEDFEYARSALRRGAHNYLLKIELSAAILQQALTDATSELKKRRRNQDLDGREEAPPGRFPITDNFFIRLLNNWFSGPKEIAEMMADLKIDCSGACFAAAYLTIMPREQGDSKEALLSMAQYMLGVIRDVCGQFAKNYVIRWNFCSFAMILALEESPRWDDPDTPLINCVRHVQDMVYKYQNESLLAGIGPVVSTVAELPGSFAQSMALSVKCTEEQSILAYDLVAAKQPQGKLMDMTVTQQEVTAALNSYDTQMVEDIFRRIMDAVSSPGTRLEQAVAMCASLVHVIIVSYGDWERLLPGIFGEGHQTYYDLYYDLHTLNAISQVQEWLAAFQEGLCRYIRENFGQNKHWLVPCIKKYIDEHYSEPLSLADVSRAFDISGGYVSAIFKKYNDTGFSECVTQAKIKHAEQLLQEPNAKVHEVSGKLGYSDPYYFSKVFKRITGISPKEYLLRSISR